MTSLVSDETIRAFAVTRAAHSISIVPDSRMDNLSTFGCACGVLFRPGERSDLDIDRHLAQAFADAGLLTHGEGR